MGRENREKIVGLNKYITKHEIYFYFLFVRKKNINRVDLYERDYFCSCVRLCQQACAGHLWKRTLDGAVDLFKKI